MNKDYPWPTATGELKFLSPGSTKKPDIVVDDITAARRDWLPGLLKELLPWMAEAVRLVAERHDPKLLHIPRTGLVPEILCEGYAVDAMYGWYAYAAAEFTARVGDTREEWPDLHADDRPVSVDTLVKVGTGLDQLNTDITHIETGPIQLVAIGSNIPNIALLLQESVWRNTQRAQRERGLKTIAILSKSCEIDLVASPRLKKFIEDQHPDWVDTYLTESNKTPTRCDRSLIADSIDKQSVFESLQEFNPRGGRLQLLAAIPSGEDQYIELTDIKASDNVSLSSGTIDRYYRELEREHEFLIVDDRGRYNSVTLTPSGRYAQSLITEEGEIRHPQQAQFTDDSTTPPTANKDSV